MILLFRRACSACHVKIGHNHYSTVTTTPIIHDALSLNIGEFSALIQGGGFERYRGEQAFKYIHQSGAHRLESWSEASYLPKRLREFLNENAPINYGSVITNQTSVDGTRKFLLNLGEKKIIETVLIPESNRATLCVSSQLGCSLQCAFCYTGTQKLETNLTAGDILRQFYALMPFVGKGMITNFVFMGQGEPLYNFRNLTKAISLLTSSEGMGFGRGKITVSTSGITPLIPKVATELGVNLAVSLHAPDDATRSSIMPINNTYPIEALMLACKEFQQNASCATKRISFEYTMLKGVNDQIEHAKKLSILVKDLQCHVNLIPFNPWPNVSFEPASNSALETFRDVLERHLIPVTIRKTRGKDIMAACGQLKSTNNTKQTLNEMISPSNIGIMNEGEIIR